jgi:hypothetical protein
VLPFVDHASVVINAPHSVGRCAQELAVRHPDPRNRRTTVVRAGPSRFNTHSGGPRPPQTPAASFKRLYRE